MRIPPQATARQIQATQDTLFWLIRLRWFAVLGQSLTVLVVDQILNIDLPLRALFGWIGVTAISNLAAFVRRVEGKPMALWLPKALLATDVAVLTALLMFTGGAGNPFAIFYLVHGTMAALVLPPRAAWLIWAECSVGYGLLFLLRHSLTELHHQAICGPMMDYELHLHGMLVSLVLTAAGIAYFVSRVMIHLRQRERELEEARAREAENERFASLATLAAGAAHELGTPLGTIAVAASELRRASAQLPVESLIRDDAELIAEEVARCRSILDRLIERPGAMGDLPRAVDVDELLDELRATFLPPERVRLVCENRCASQPVVAPPLALVQGLGVLVKNALDASGPVDPIRITVERFVGGVRFRVDDMGSGLESEPIGHIGEPFYTTKEPGRGMGLGLFLVRLLAQRLNGSFSLETKPVGGTRATLVIAEVAPP